MTYSEFKSIILNEFPPLEEIQYSNFEKLENLYKEWNSKINVISRKDIDQVYRHHILHSLAIAAYIKRELAETFNEFLNGIDKRSQKRIKILDLGTGGGFPGIPLAILFPNIEFTLCDSVGKKIIVASEVAKALNLTNVSCVNARAESIKEDFDYVVSRAVTSLDKFMPWVKGKYRKGILYLKGGDVVEEIALTMGQFKLRPGSVNVWKINNWLNDIYFDEKLVIHIEA